MPLASMPKALVSVQHAEQGLLTSLEQASFNNFDHMVPKLSPSLCAIWYEWYDHGDITVAGQNALRLYVAQPSVKDQPVLHSETSPSKNPFLCLCETYSQCGPCKRPRPAATEQATRSCRQACVGASRCERGVLGGVDMMPWEHVTAPCVVWPLGSLPTSKLQCLQYRTSQVPMRCCEFHHSSVRCQDSSSLRSP